MSFEWNAKEYHAHSLIQYRAARDILSWINFQGNEQVLDLGCGDGKITQEIAIEVPGGSVQGLDKSNAMIQFAKKKYPSDLHKNLLFTCQDANQIKYINKFDLVFSSFMLQWVFDKRHLFFLIYRALVDFGRFCATMPLGYSAELERSVGMLVSTKKWEKYFANFKKSWDFSDEQAIKTDLNNSGFVIQNIRRVCQTHVFESEKAFSLYVGQWLPHLVAIPSGLKFSFLNELIDVYLGLIQPNTTGKVYFKFPRLDFVVGV